MTLRTSLHIDRKQARNFKPAVRLAALEKAELNFFITINFNHTLCDEKRASQAFAKLRNNHFGPWCRRPSRKASVAPIAPTSIWSLENANHLAAHWLVHIPLERLADFRRRLPIWLEKVTGGITCAANAISIEDAYGPMGAAKYMLKGINPAYGKFYGIDPVPQGLVHGKRCGFSQNLGPQACRENNTYWAQMSSERRALERHGNIGNYSRSL